MTEIKINLFNVVRSTPMTSHEVIVSNISGDYSEIINSLLKECKESFNGPSGPYSEYYDTFSLDTTVRFIARLLKNNNSIESLPSSTTEKLLELLNSIDITKYGKILEHISPIFKILEVTEDQFIGNYKILERFKNSIFKKNPELKKSDAVQLRKEISKIEKEKIIQNKRNYYKSLKDIPFNFPYPTAIDFETILKKQYEKVGNYEVPEGYEDLFFRRYKEMKYYTSSSHIRDIETIKFAAVNILKNPNYLKDYINATEESDFTLSFILLNNDERKKYIELIKTIHKIPFKSPWSFKYGYFEKTLSPKFKKFKKDVQENINIFIETISEDENIEILKSHLNNTSYLKEAECGFLNTEDITNLGYSFYIRDYFSTNTFIDSFNKKLAEKNGNE